MRSLATRISRPASAIGQVLDDGVRAESMCRKCSLPKWCMTDGPVTKNELNEVSVRKMLGLCLCEGK